MHVAQFGSEHNAYDTTMQVAYSRRVPKEAYRGPRWERRKERFRELVAQRGGPKAVADVLDTPASHVSAMASGARGIGDELADRIEARYGLENGYLDRASDGAPVIVPPSVSPEGLSAWGSAVANVSPEVRVSVVGMLETYFKDPRANKDMIPLIVRRVSGEFGTDSGQSGARKRA